jgi:hypothetical protein
MVRVAKPTDPKKLAELKKKIHDPQYLDMAIVRIANTLTKEIMSLKDGADV